eukprot:COSAG05_NODE_8770_length_673_cov_1.393728_1_plen_135_part_00
MPRRSRSPAPLGAFKTPKRIRRHGSKAKSKALVLAQQSEKVVGFGDQYQTGIRMLLTEAQQVEPEILVCLLDLVQQIEQESTKGTKKIPATRAKSAVKPVKPTRKVSAQCKCGATTHLRTSSLACRSFSVYIIL